MPRQLPSFAALLLCSVSLAACSTFGGSGAANAQSTSSSDQPAVSQSSSGDLESDLRQAQILRSQGDIDGAIKVLGQLMIVSPDDPRIVSEYGKALAQQGRAQDAIAFLSRAVQLSPKDASVYSTLGVAYDELGDSAHAKQAYEHALSLTPGDPVVLNNYALSEMLAGNVDSAKRMIAQAAAADSSNPKIARNVDYIGKYHSAVAAAAPSKAPAAVRTKRSAAPTAVASLPTPTAHDATGSTPTANQPGVVMERVPVDPLAGPVAHHGPTPLVAKKDKAPALRMSADAN